MLLLAASVVLGVCPLLRRASEEGGDDTSRPAPARGATASPGATARPAPTVGPLLWSDEFDGPAGSSPDPATWRTRTGAGGWGNGELQCYTDEPANLSLDGEGCLRLTMQRRDVVDDAGNAARFTSGRVETVETFDASRIEARMRVPRGIGLWAAFWTVGADFDTVGWPRCGEVDVLEHYDEAEVVEVVAHAGKVDDAGATLDGREWQAMTRVQVPGLDEALHVYAVDIGEDALVFSVDGVQRAVVRRADRAADEHWPFAQPQRLVLNLAMSRWLGDREPPLPASVVVDWVRVYARRT